MASKNETRQIALQFVTNAEETKTKVDALLQSLDKTSTEYSQLESESASLASAITDVNNAMNKGTENSNILNNSISKLEQETKKATSSLDKITQSTVKQKVETTALNTETKGLTSSITSNGGAMAILDSLTGGLATKFRDAREASALFTTANTASTGAMTGASVAAKALRVALATIGIGLIIAAVGYLVANWDNLKKSFNDFLPTIGLTSESFEKVKAIVVGVGGAVVDFLIAPIKSFIKLVQGDFRGAVAEIGAGFDVVTNYNQAKNDQIERDNQAHRDKEFQSEIDNDARHIERQRNQGKNVDKLEKDLLNKKTNYYKKDSEEYRKAIIDKENFEDRQVAERRKKAQEASKERIRIAQEQSEKLKQLELDRFEFQKKLQDLRDEMFLNSAVNPTDEIIKKNEIQIRKLNEAREVELKSLKKLYKESSELYKEGTDEINRAYDARVKKIEDSTSEVTTYFQESNVLIAELQGILSSGATSESLTNYYKETLKFVDGIKSADLKKYYEEMFQTDQAKENIKYIETLTKTWEDFNASITSNDSEYRTEEMLKNFNIFTDTAGDYIGTLRKVENSRLADLESEKELNIKKLTELGIYEDNRLELEKYYANKAIEIANETAEEIEKVEQRKRDARIATLDVTSNAVNSEMMLTDALLSFASEADQERIKASGAYKTRMIALTTIDMLSGAVSAYTSAMGSTGNPITDQILGISSAAAVVATGLANIKKIESVKLPDSGGSSGASVSPSTAPNVQFVSSSENQIANSVNQNANANQDKPMKAYVVTSEINSGLELERNAINSNSI